MAVNLPTRLAEKISESDTGCWLWCGAKAPGGYGQVRQGPSSKLAHRVVYEFLVGPIAGGLVLDHLCFTTACVNPKHLRPITIQQNAEHRQGATRVSTSGARNVSWYKSRNCWQVQVKSGGKNHFGGYFTDIEQASRAAAALRARLFSHDDGRLA